MALRMGTWDFSAEYEKYADKYFPDGQWYFSVSPWKLVVMSVCTLGFYEIWWFFSNWILVKVRQDLAISPLWRFIFSFIYCFSLFKIAYKSANRTSAYTLIFLGFATAAWIIVSLLDYLVDPYSIFSLFSVIFLIPVQIAMNKVNDSVSPDHDRNREFSGLNRFGIIAGGSFVAIMMFEAIFLKA
jgi:hypothetical protein